ncbi:MAG TPA: hypothetical protein VL172_11315, partial [Kofleriaceae bacterium]|nr:hypothetical protein [Kofleriaceae bacterium]
MIILVALLAGGAVMLSLQLGSTKQVALASSARGALFCAESGLVGSRDFITANATDWPNMLAGNDVDGYPVTGDL